MANDWESAGALAGMAREGDHVCPSKGVVGAEAHIDHVEDGRGDEEMICGRALKNERLNGDDSDEMHAFLHVAKHPAKKGSPWDRGVKHCVMCQGFTCHLLSAATVKYTMNFGPASHTQLSACGVLRALSEEKGREKRGIR